MAEDQRDTSETDIVACSVLEIDHAGRLDADLRGPRAHEVDRGSTVRSDLHRIARTSVVVDAIPPLESQLVAGQGPVRDEALESSRPTVNLEREERIRISSSTAGATPLDQPHG